MLAINQEALRISCEQPSLAGCFAELIRKAHAASGERVVVLVDEYDKPILDNITAPRGCQFISSASSSAAIAAPWWGSRWRLCDHPCLPEPCKTAPVQTPSPEP